MKAKRFIKTAAAGFAVGLCFLLLPTTTPAKTRTPNSDSGTRYIPSLSADVSQILSVLENRIEDQKLIERTKDKLLTLDQRQIRLIASLSDRVAKEGNTPGSDIAFLLMTALITLI